MGGSVPWSSKGCMTCRKRKVKCDLQKPQCGGCTKRRIACPGYTHGRYFFAHYSASRNPNSESPKNHQNDSELDAQIIKRAQVLPRRIDGHFQRRMQLHASFMAAYYPPSLRTEAIRNVDLFYQLMSSFLDLPTKSAMLETALSAMSCLYFGAASHNQALLHQGTCLYNNSINFMTSQIRKGTITDDMVYTSVIFKAIETFNCPGGTRSTGAHMDGHNSLLRASSPPTNSSLMRLVLKLQKQGLMYAPMLFKSFGSDFDYLKRYSDDPPFDDLFEIYVDITSLAAAANSIDLSGPQDRDCKRLLWSCQETRQKALEWYSHHLENIGGRPTASSNDMSKKLKVPLAPFKKLFGTQYEFISLRQAEFHIFFWKVMVIIHFFLYRAQVLVLQCSHLNTNDDIPSDPRAYRECLHAGEYADEICRALPYFLQEDLGNYGMLKITVNLPYVFKPYTHLRWQQKFFWIQKICQSVAGDSNDLALCHSQVWWKYWFLCDNPVFNFARSLAFGEDYAERYHVVMENERVKVIKVTKDGEDSGDSELPSESVRQ